MNKIGMVLGLAAVAAVAGCKDPNWNRNSRGDEVKNVGTVVEPTPVANEGPAKAAEPTPFVVEEQHCTCAPGTKHEFPCACGAPDCRCVVEKKEVKPLPPPEPEYTVYIVQRGDYLAKISKKYNVTINSIKRLNNLKDDNIRIGQKLKLPGKIEVGEQKVPEGAFAKPAAKATKAFAPYTGATKEYIVKSGDTLGSIAYGNGINIRQLKEMNGLTSDSLKIGQKLKIPAEKVVTAKKADAKAKPAAQKVEAKTEATKSDKSVEDALKQVEEVKAAEPAVETPAVEATPTPVPAADNDTITYTVQEGEDLADVSIRWGVSAAAVRELNNLGENDKLKGGQVLRLPADAQQQ
jgi:LysM repeat protein